MIFTIYKPKYQCNFALYPAAAVDICEASSPIETEGYLNSGEAPYSNGLHCSVAIDPPEGKVNSVFFSM